MPALHLPVLDTLLARTLAQSKNNLLIKTAVVYIHHALHTSVPLLDAMLKLGLAPGCTFVLGKHYSECQAVVEDVKKLGINYQPCSVQMGIGNFSHSFIYDVNLLWLSVLTKLKDKDIDNLIVMDHGGYAAALIPAEILEKYRVVGIEKTTAGLKNPAAQGLTFPIIDLASCAAKKWLESPFIAEAVVKKLTPLIPAIHKDMVCGVLGYGAIGEAVTNKLLSMGHKVIVYDSTSDQLKKVKGATPSNNNSAMLELSDYLFGCTGTSSISSIDSLMRGGKNKTLISCSSGDIEFLSVLQFIQQQKNELEQSSLKDILYTTELGSAVHILRGGFPINFDDSGESVPANDIQLTRSLVFMSVLQAMEFFKEASVLSKEGHYMLDPKLQKAVVDEWFKYQRNNRFSAEIRDDFQDEKWIAQNSGGIFRAYS